MGSERECEREKVYVLRLTMTTTAVSVCLLYESFAAQDFLVKNAQIYILSFCNECVLAA